MGVLPNARKVHIHTGASNSEMSSSTNTDDESGVSTPAQVPIATGRPPRPQPTGLPALVSKNIGYRLHLKKGRRSKQRYENERLLVAMYGVDSEDIESGKDLCKQYRSHFQDILEQQNQDILDEFLNQEEGKYFTIQETEEENDLTREDEQVCTEEQIQAEDAFLRISWRMRQALKRNIPHGIIKNIEQNINQNFITNPSSEYVCEMSSYERLLVHALSAFYSLNSYSYDQDGKRLVKVENPRKTFNPKDPGLAEYLLLRYNQ